MNYAARLSGTARGMGLVLTLSLGASIGEAKIVNGDFANPKVPAGGFQQIEKNGVPGWKTTDSHIEIWSSGMKYGQVVFRAPAGLTQFAEINAHTAGTLSQTVTNIGVGNKYGFSFYHRGRESATVKDVVKVRVVDTVTKAVLLDQNFSTTNADWQRYTVDLGVKKDNNALELSFTAVSSAAGTDLSIGNFLAGVELGESFMAPPTPTGPMSLSSHGDVHINSPDGLLFDYHGVGDFYGIRSTDGNFDVVARQVSWVNNPKVTINAAVALRFAKAKATLEFYALPKHKLVVNGVDTPIPTQDTTLPSGVNLKLAHGGILVDYEGHELLVTLRAGYLDYGMRRTVNPSVSYRGGLIGNRDGKADNDMILPNGTVTPVPADAAALAAFGEAWRVPAGEKYFGVPHPAAPKPTETSEVEPAKVESARQTCQNAGISQVLALKDCTFDVSRTGNNAFVESARQFQDDVKAIPPAQLKGGDQRTAAAIARGVDVEPAPAAAGGGGGGLFGLGEELRRGNQHTMNGHYVTFQPDGNLCVYTNAKQFVCCVNNDPKVRYQDAQRVVFTNEGQLTMFNGANQPLWQQPARGAGQGSKVQITSSGALQIVGPNGAVSWSSK
jgi:hypothetical protein